MLDLMAIFVTVVSVLLIVALGMCWCLVAISARSERQADQQMAEWARKRHWCAREDDPEGKL